MFSLYRLAGLAPYRRCQLSSNVRQHTSEPRWSSPSKFIVPTRFVPAIERLLVAVGTGVASLLLLVNIIELQADKPLSDVNPAHVEALGRWLLPVYAGAIAFFTAGIPLGAVCGFLCGKRRPHYSLAAAAIVTLPFMASHFSDPSVYFASLVVSLGHYFGCVVGVIARTKLYPAPLLGWSGARSSPPTSILSADAVLLAAFVFLCTSVHALARGSGSYTSVVIALVFTAAMLFARCRMRVATVASAA